MIHEQQNKKKRYIQKLGSVFRAVDMDRSGTLSKDEFNVVMANPKVKTWLQVLELEVHDAEALFRLLDDGDGEVTYDEFLKGVMRLKGQARSIDVVAIMRSGDKTLDLCKRLQSQIHVLTQWQLQVHADELGDQLAS